MKYIKLSQWAKDNGYTYQGAYRLYKASGLENTKVLPTGTILIQVENEVNTQPIIKTKECIIYCRVSSNKQKEDLERQIERMKYFATNNGYIIKKVYKEVASGMNDSRSELTRMLESSDNIFLLVEHNDRLTRFGFNYLNMYCNNKGIEIIVANESKSEKDEMINDLVSVVTSFCAKLYGARKCKRKTESIIKEIKNEE